MRFFIGGKENTEIFISFIDGTETIKSKKIIMAENTADIKANLKTASFFAVKNGISTDKNSKITMILPARGISIFSEKFKNSKNGKADERQNKRESSKKTPRQIIFTAREEFFKVLIPDLKRKGANRNKAILKTNADKNPENE